MATKWATFKSSQYVNIDYELAPPVIRAVASILDLIALYIYYLIISSVINFSAFGIANMKGYLILDFFFWSIPWIFYSPIIEYFTNGRSLGKLIMGIRVVTMNGETAGFREYFTRWIFRLIDLWVGGFGFIALLFSSTSENRQRLGDLMANTVVIRTKDSQVYHLSDVLTIKSQDNHTATYPEVTQFSDDDMLLIKNTILRVQTHPNPETKKFAIELAETVSEKLKLAQVPDKKLEFLKIVLQDYIVLTR